MTQKMIKLNLRGTYGCVSPRFVSCTPLSYAARDPLMSFCLQPTLLYVLLFGLLAGQTARGQDRALPPRQLAPGVITTIKDATIDDDTSDGPREFTELLSVVRPRAWRPNFEPVSQTLLELARKVTFQREIWALEFGFKPLRIIRVGERDIWYLVYFVRNNGDTRSPHKNADRTYTLTNVSRTLRFIPTFVFESHGLRKAYHDRTLPEVVRMIAAKERVPGDLHNSGSIGRVRIPVSTPTEDHRVWGVATWDNVDPRTDFISIFVQGLTNAYRWQPPADGYQPNAQVEQDQVLSKTLKLNFWRAGDAIDLHEGEIQFGIPLYPREPERQQEALEIYQIPKPVEYQWVFR